MRDVSPMSGVAVWRSFAEYQQSDAFGEILKAEFQSIYGISAVARSQSVEDSPWGVASVVSPDGCLEL